MQIINRLFVTGVALLLATSILTACGGKEERKAKYLERGKVYLLSLIHISEPTRPTT